MPRVFFIFVLLLCAPSHAAEKQSGYTFNWKPTTGPATCPFGGACGGSLPSAASPASSPTGDLANKLNSAGLTGAEAAAEHARQAGNARIRAEDLRERNKRIQAKIDNNTEKINANTREITSLEGQNPKNEGRINSLKSENSTLKNENTDLTGKRNTNEEKAKGEDTLAKYEDLQSANAKGASNQNFAGANQLAGGNGGSGGKSGGSGMPFMPPPGGGSKGGDDSGGGDKQNELKAVAVATPGPLPSPGAVPGANSANDQLLSAKELAAAMESKSNADDAAKLKSSQAIAAMTQQSADMAAQTLALQKETAALRAKLSQQEMEGGFTPRTTGAVVASNKTGTGSKSGSPFDLSTKSASGAPSFGSNSSGPVMNAMQVTQTTPKQQASSRLLASATGSNSDLTIGATANEPAMKSGLAVKKITGPVYGRSSKSSSSSTTYKNMTVPQGLRTAMQTRIAIVGGATPENHQPAQTQQVAVRPATSTSTSEGYAHARRNTQLLKAHIIIR